MKQALPFLLCLSALGLFGAPAAHAQEVVPDTITVVKAQVVEILNQGERLIPGTQTSQQYQQIKIKILEGESTGESITIENDYLMLQPGEVFYAIHTSNRVEGRDTWAVSGPDRLPTLELFGALFLLCLFIFGGWQGARGLVSLIASVGFITYLLIPGILAGYPPLLVAIGVATIIIVAGSYITHGFNRTTTAAVVGMLATIIITGLLAYAAVHSARLSGFTTEEAAYLNFDTQGHIDFIGLLLGSLMIGFLGVLYDAAISQAIAVEELVSIGKDADRPHIFKRALRIGREHIGALVNILAIAYVGASLPLLLLFKVSAAQSPLITINQELFATEILRTLVGSIGLILAVPITTAIAVYMLWGKIKPAAGSRGHHH